MDSFVTAKKFAGKVDPAQIVFKAPQTNKYGSKSIYLRYGAKHDAPKAQFARARVPFPVRDTDFDGNPTDIRNMAVEFGADDIAMIRAIENRVIDMGVKNAQAWFGKKKMSREVVESKLESLIKKSKKEEYEPTVRVKINAMDDQDRATVIRQITSPDGASELEYDLAKASAIGRNSEVAVIGSFNNLWFAGGMFGLKLVAKDVLLWPVKQAWQEENPFQGFNLKRRKTEHTGNDGDLPVGEFSAQNIAFNLPPPGPHAPTYTCATEGCAGDGHENGEKRKRDDDEGDAAAK